MTVYEVLVDLDGTTRSQFYEHGLYSSREKAERAAATLDLDTRYQRYKIVERKVL